MPPIQTKIAKSEQENTEEELRLQTQIKLQEVESKMTDELELF